MSDDFLPYLQAACGLFGVGLLLVLAGWVLLAAVSLYLGLASLFVAVKYWLRDRGVEVALPNLLSLSLAYRLVEF